MSLQLAPEHARAIDDGLRAIHASGYGGELQQLAKLFKRRALPAVLQTVIEPTLRTGRSYREDIEVKLAWIDKRPLAKLARHTKRVELGDAAIFYLDRLRCRDRITWRPARALILQAKVAKERGQLAAPAVPVNPTRPARDSSTAREFDLLSSWSTFDLYATSGSKNALATGITAAPTSLPPGNGWYMAAPWTRPDADAKRAWASPWMCAPAVMAAPCITTLGQLLLAFLRCDEVGAGLPSAGEEFRFHPDALKKPQGSDWQRVCVEILRLCPKYRLPKALVGEFAGEGSIVRSFPYVGGGGTSGLLLDLLTFLFPKKMFVLVVLVTRTEGE